MVGIARTPRPHSLVSFALVALAACSSGSARDVDSLDAASDAARLDTRPQVTAPRDTGAAMDPTPISDAGSSAVDAKSSGSPDLLTAAPDGGGDRADGGTPSVPAPGKLHVILDSDTAAEVDDQHAMAYLLFSAGAWFIEGITTNATNQTGNGANVKGHTEEAQRVVQLCASEKSVNVYSGASGKFADIQSHLNEAAHDAKAAVDFIVQSASHHTPQDKLLIIAIGKLTNVALAMKKQPDIVGKIRVIWLGSDWSPTKDDADEYNEKNDYAAVNYLFDSQVEMSVVLVRFGEETGTYNIMVNESELRGAYAKGHGPDINPPVKRGDRSFTNFGDYSISLWANAGQRPVFDLVAIAVAKNPKWATAADVGAPIIEGTKIKPRPDNARKVRYYSAFRPHREEILNDFFGAVNKPVLQK